MERIGLEPGTEVGGYRIVSPLGAGAMGAVYRAVDGDGNVVAFKVLHAHVAADADMRARLGREIAALRRVDHPAVAHLLDAEPDASEMFIVTELVDGPTLEAEIADGGPLGPTDLYELADQLADALVAVHGAGVIHRDLKPSNVLISPEGPVLIDFGIAHGLEDARMTSVGFVMGTPGYLAPELIDRGDPSPATDWWGWAAMLVYAATGRAPFGVRPLDAVIARAHSGDPDTAGLGPVTTAALRGALDANPARRWSAERVVEALRVAADRGDVPGTSWSGLGGYGSLAAGAAGAAAAHQGATSVVKDAPQGTEVVGPDHAQQDQGYPPSPHEDGTQVAAWGAAGGAGTGTSVMPAYQSPDRQQPQQMPPSYGPGHASPHGQPGPYDQQGRYGEPGPGEHPYQPGPPAGFDPVLPGYQQGGGDRGYVPPSVPHRTLAVLALAVPFVIAGATFPGRTVVALLVAVVLCRIVGISHSSLHGRREQRGVRASDGVQAVLRGPWHVVRALLTTIPSLLVAASAVVVLCGPVWWLLQTDRLVIGSNGSGGGTAPDGGNEPWVYAIVLGVAAFLTAVLLWFGPVTSLARHGARVALNVVAPGWVGTLVLVLLAALASWLFLGAVLDGRVVEWSPLQPPPRFDR